MRTNNADAIQQFSEDLKNYLSNLLERSMGWDDEKDIIKIMADLQLAAELTAKLAKEVAWLSNGEINSKTFMKRYKAIEAEYETKLAQVTK